MLRSLVARVCAAALLFLLTAPASAQTTYTWTGNGSDAGWFNDANWSAVGPAGPPPLNDLTNTFVILAGNNQVANTLDYSFSTNKLTFAAGSGAFVVGTVIETPIIELTIGTGGIEVASGNTSNKIINANLALGTAGVWQNNGTGTFTINGLINNGGNLLTVSGTGNSIYNGIISGAGGLTKTGSGTLTVTGVNTYTGNVTVTGGTLRVSGDRAFGAVPGAATAGKIVLDGGTIAATTGFTLSGNRGIRIDAGGGTISIPTAQTLSYNGIIAGTGSLTIAGPGQFTLRGTATWTGPLVVNGGGTLNFDDRLRLNAASTATITLDNGTLYNTIAGNAGTFSPASRNIVLGAGGGTLRWDDTGTTSGNPNIIIVQTGTVISGVGGLTKAGPGIIAVVTPATYDGPTQVTGGTLRVRTNSHVFPTGTALTVDSGATFDLSTLNQQVGSLSGAGTVNVAGGTFTVGDAASTIFSGVVQGTNGKLIKQGSGTLTLNGVNTYTGATNISGGTLALGNGGSVTSVVSVNNTGTLAGTGTVNGGVTVVSGGRLAAGTNGAGNLTITGNTILHSGGRLAVGAAANGTNSRVNVVGGSTTFDFKIGSTLELTLLSGFSNGLPASYTLVSMPAGSGANVLLGGAVTTNGQVLGSFVEGTGASGSVIIMPSGFALSPGDMFTLSRVGDAVMLNFTPVPEPATVLGLAAGALGLGGLIRRRFRRGSCGVREDR